MKRCSMRFERRKCSTASTSLVSNAFFVIMVSNGNTDMDWVRKNERIGANRMRFILETLKDLDQTLCQMGTRLFVLQGDSKTVVKKFCKGRL